MMPNYISNVETSNKVWSYDLHTNSFNVTVKWGRLGLEGQQQIKEFSNSYDRDQFTSKKVQEKMDKGYKEVTHEELEVQTSIAKMIGSNKKIDTLAFVEDDGTYLAQIPSNELHKPNRKPKVYAKVVGNKNKDGETPTDHFLFDVDSAYQIYPAGYAPVLTRMLVNSRKAIELSDDSAPLASAVASVIGRVLL